MLSLLQYIGTRYILGTYGIRGTERCFQYWDWAEFADRNHRYIRILSMVRRTYVHVCMIWAEFGKGNRTYTEWNRGIFAERNDTVTMTLGGIRERKPYVRTYTEWNRGIFAERNDTVTTVSIFIAWNRAEFAEHFPHRVYVRTYVGEGKFSLQWNLRTLHHLRGQAIVRHRGSKRAQEELSYRKWVRDVKVLAEGGKFFHGRVIGPPGGWGQTVLEVPLNSWRQCGEIQSMVWSSSRSSRRRGSGVASAQACGTFKRKEIRLSLDRSSAK